LSPDKLRDSALRSKVDTLQGEDGKSTPFCLSASTDRSEVIDEFEKLLIKATTSFNTQRHKGVSLRLHLHLPFVIFEFCAMVVCCAWDCGSFFASVFVTWVRGANVCNNYVLVW
jgi:hypothetical protein